MNIVSSFSSRSSELNICLKCMCKNPDNSAEIYNKCFRFTVHFDLYVYDIDCSEQYLQCKYISFEKTQCGTREQLAVHCVVQQKRSRNVGVFRDAHLYSLHTRRSQLEDAHRTHIIHFLFQNSLTLLLVYLLVLF